MASAVASVPVAVANPDLGFSDAGEQAKTRHRARLRGGLNFTFLVVAIWRRGSLSSERAHLQTIRRQFAACAFNPRYVGP